MEAEEEAITHTLERRLEMVSQAWHTVTIAAAIHYSLFAKIYFLALHCISFSPCIPQASQEQEAVVGKLHKQVRAGPCVWQNQVPILVQVERIRALFL